MASGRTLLMKGELPARHSVSSANARVTLPGYLADRSGENAIRYQERPPGRSQKLVAAGWQ
jgi:hypothetical protein